MKNLFSLGEEPDLPFPPIEQTSNVMTDQQKGDAGEKISRIHLLCEGVSTLETNPWEAYDLLAEMHNKFFKIQVKTLTSKDDTLTFNFRRGYHKSVKGCFDYKESDFDISACVSLAERRVLFSPGYEKSISWKRHQFRVEGAESLSWYSAVDEVLKRRLKRESSTWVI